MYLYSGSYSLYVMVSKVLLSAARGQNYVHDVGVHFINPEDLKSRFQSP